MARKEAEEIIEQKSIELQELNQELLKANHCLEEKVQSRTLELETTLRELKELNQELSLAKEKAELAIKTKDNFLATMTHEIRTPLNAVIGIAYQLLRDNPTEKQSKHLETLRFSAENLLSLVNDILDYNKMEAEKLEFEKIPFNIKSLCQKVRNTWAIKANEKGVRLKYVMDSEVDSLVLGDPTRLSQVLNNLLGNALKFTEKGKIVLTVEEVFSNQEKLHVCFRVNDTGIGIPSAKLESIFDHFTQADSSTSRKYGGSGLGLAICNKLLLLQQSQLKVSSIEGEGTTFSFVLVFDRAEEYMEEEPPTVIDPQALNEVTILVVEDNQINQQVIRWMLLDWGCKVTFAGDGYQALELVSKETYDIILMDLHMPMMDGLETTKRIRSTDNDNKQVPILAVTAAAMMGEVRNDILEAGMNGVISKPFKPEELFVQIQEALSGKYSS
ncbi:response regulator [Algivirga pacifica]|uniref:response regulator n=1 Tax=Algivirga pacifica TaxID=1162670 RepID=UPI0031EF63BD